MILCRLLLANSQEPPLVQDLCTKSIRPNKDDGTQTYFSEYISIEASAYHLTTPKRLCPPRPHHSRQQSIGTYPNWAHVLSCSNNHSSTHQDIQTCREWEIRLFATWKLITNCPGRPNHKAKLKDFTFFFFFLPPPTSVRSRSTSTQTSLGGLK